MTEEKNINEEVKEIEAGEKLTTEENETKSESKAMPPKKRGGEIKDWVKSIIIAAFIAVVLMQLIVPTVVREHSMEPSFYGGDYLIVGKISYKAYKSSVTRTQGWLHRVPHYIYRSNELHYNKAYGCCNCNLFYNRLQINTTFKVKP